MPTHKQIMITVEVQERLRNHGRTGESFDTVLRRLLGMEVRPRKRSKYPKKQEGHWSDDRANAGIA